MFIFPLYVRGNPPCDMRKFVSILLFFLLFAFGGFVYEGRVLDAESKAYVDAAVISIVTRWDADELWRRASPDMRRLTTLARLHGLFDQLGKLGSLTAYKGARGEANIPFIIGGSARENTISATYLAKAQFQNGLAIIKIIVLKLSGIWVIQDFHVDAHQAKIEEAL